MKGDFTEVWTGPIVGPSNGVSNQLAARVVVVGLAVVVVVVVVVFRRRGWGWGWAVGFAERAALSAGIH